MSVIVVLGETADDDWIANRKFAGRPHGGLVALGPILNGGDTIPTRSARHACGSGG